MSMTAESAITIIKADADMVWEAVAVESDPAKGSRLTEENYWSPNVETGRKARHSMTYPPFSDPYFMRPSSEQNRWEDEL